MAVVIASNLRKEIAGSLLFEGVSFSVERRDRLSLSGPNGAGKTTLLRMLAGETEVHGGEVVFAKGTRLALHDQRPPLQHGLSLREYALSGAADLLATEEELHSLERAMAAGDHGPATLRRYSEAQGRLEHAGGYDWRRARRAGVARPRLRRGRARPPARHVLGRRADARLPRAGARRRPRSAPARRADEPPRRREPRMARAGAPVARRGGDPRRARPLVPRSRHDGGARARGRPVALLPGPWHAWRREKAARAAAAARTAERVGVDIARLERFVERFRYKKSKAKQAQAKLTQIGRLQTRARPGLRRVRAAHAPEQVARVRLLQAEPQRPHGGRGEGLGGLRGREGALAQRSFAVERGEHVGLVGPNGSGKTTLLETILATREQVAGSVRLGLRRRGRRTSRSTRSSSTSAAACSTARSVRPASRAAAGAVAPGPVSLLGLGGAREARRRRSPAASGDGSRSRWSSRPGRIFLVLDEPTNHLDLESREALEAALDAFPGTLLLVSHDRALLDAVATRLLAIEGETVRSYEGGWAEYYTSQAEAEAPPVAEQPMPARRKRAVAAPANPRARTRSSRSKLRSRRARSRSPSSSAAWPRTGRTSTRSPRTGSRARAPVAAYPWEELFERSR